MDFLTPDRLGAGAEGATKGATDGAVPAFRRTRCASATRLDRVASAGFGALARAHVNEAPGEETAGTVI